jgi:hypothetical protein
MADDPALETQPRSFIERALDECRDNVKTHRSLQIREFSLATILMFIVAVVPAVLAQSQFEENKLQYDKLYQQVSSTKEDVDHAELEWRKEMTSAPLAFSPMSPKPSSDMPSEKGKTLTATTAAAAPSEGFNGVKFASQRYSDTVSTYNKASAALENYKPSELISEKVLYGAAALFVLILSVTLSLYRIHLREITKNEFFRFAILRIATAAANKADVGYDSEVRTALLDRVFEPPAEPSGWKRGQKVESPIPGHPTSDLLASALNRLLDQSDLVLKPKKDD